MARKTAGSWRPPEDMNTWLIRQAMADGLDTSKLDPAAILKGLLPVEFAAIHTTVTTAHDLLSSDPSLNYLAALRDEVSAAAAA